MRGTHSFMTRLTRSRLLLLLILGGVVSAGLLSLWAADLEEPRAKDRRIALVVSALMRRDHLSKHPLNNEISQRGLERYIKSLDPMKVYFYQSDIDEFMKNRDELDDQLAKGNIDIAYTIFNRFLKRIDERIAMVNELLQKEQDFTIDEEMVTDRKLVKYAGNREVAMERWRKRIKYDLLVLKGDKTEGKEAVDKLNRRYRGFATRMGQFNQDDLLEMYLTAITTSYDPHTTYMSPTSLEDFLILMRLELEGIGAQLSSVDGNTVVSKVIQGGAADKNGKLKPEDKIVNVGQGEEGDSVDIVDMRLTDVVRLIRGKAGTIVRLGVIPSGSNETKTYKITRAKIELKDSEARSVIFKAGKKEDGTPMKVGVINLPSFYMDMRGANAKRDDYKSTTRDVRRILEEFKKDDVDSVVLDLRRNGGGALKEAINLTGLFIDRGPVVQVKDSDGEVEKYDDLERGMTWEGPLVVLTSKFSASASEILAGAIKDYGRGLIVGDESSHGKGTVQSLMYVGPQLFQTIPNPPNLGALKITIQQFYRPNGDSTQKRGVLADIVLPSVSNHMDVGEADLDYPLDFDRVPTAEYGRLDMVSKELIASLKSKSLARRQKSEEFDKLLKNIKRYREQKARKSVTLNEKKFFALRSELDAEKEDKKQFEEQGESKDEIVERNFYFNEVLDITVDYANYLKKNKFARN